MFQGNLKSQRRDYTMLPVPLALPTSLRTVVRCPSARLLADLFLALDGFLPRESPTSDPSRRLAEGGDVQEVGSEDGSG